MTGEPWDDYAYTALIVFCFLLKDGKILLIRRANEPYKGEITIPGGRKQRGESLREACAREMKEETGYTLGEMQYVGFVHDIRQGDKREYVSHYFICRDFSGEATASEDGDGAPCGVVNIYDHGVDSGLRVAYFEFGRRTGDKAR